MVELENNIKKNMSQKEDKPQIIGENTPVRIGLIMLFLGVFASGVWWASAVNSKLDSILSAQNSATATFSRLKAEDAFLGKEISQLRLQTTINEKAINTLQEKIGSLSPK